MPSSFQNWLARSLLGIDLRATNLGDPNTPINGYTLSQLFGGAESASGKTVNHENALNFSAVWACTRILSGVIGSMSLGIYERMPNGRRKAEDHPFYRVTKYPNKYQTRAVFLQRAIIHYLNWGYHISIIKLGSNSLNLELVHPSRLKSIKVSSRDTLIFNIMDQDGKEKTYPQSQILYVPNLGDELIGKGIIAHAREDIGLEFGAQEYGAKWFNKGGQAKGLIHTDEKLNSDQIKELKKSYEIQKGQDGNMVLTHGFKYSPMTIPAEDAQFLGTRRFDVLTIARWYGVPPEKLAELDRATYGNIEHNAIAFLADTVSPILSKFEGEYTMKLLDEDKYYFEFDMDSYMRSDIKTQAEVDRIYTAGGIRQINEIRQKKNWNPVEGGDENYMQLNMTTIKNIQEGKNINLQENGMESEE